MLIKKCTTLLAAIAVGGIYASPCSLSASHVVSDAPTTTTPLPPDTTCNFEGRRWVSGLRPLASYYGAEDPSECWQICNDAFHSPYCVSFTYTPTRKTCVFSESRVGFGVEASPGRGVYFWDKACWADYPACTPETPAPGCLAANAICGDSGTYSDFEEFATYRHVTRGLSECAEMCNGPSYASRCKSFLYYDYSDIGICYFYDQPAENVIVRNDGSAITWWDKECSVNSGPCESGST